MRFYFIFIMMFVSFITFAQSAKSYFEKGLLKYNNFDYHESIRLLDSAIILNPQYSEAYNCRGLDKGYLEDYKGAIDDYNKAIEINPEYGMAYHNRGISKKNVGDIQGACDDWNKALGMGVDGVKMLIGLFCKDIKP
jgi:tetratricopeptide (TPR) repeat protein